MTPTRPHSDPELRPEDADFVRRLAEAYAPAPLPPQRRVAFREALDRRLEGERRRGGWLPVLGGLATAAAALALVLMLAPEPSRRATPQAADAPQLARAQTALAEEEALLALFASDAEADSDSDELPEDYQAIAGLFLGEV